MAGSVVRGLGATIALLVVLAAGVAVLGGGVAAVLAVTVDDPPAEQQAADEAADVAVLRCGRARQHLTARIRVTNDSSRRSDYFVDVEFVRTTAPYLAEVVPVVVEDLAPGDSRPETVESARATPRSFDCRIGDVDRLSS